MSTAAIHHNHMARAISLAKRGRFTTLPNPMVGCVLVKDGRVIGEGWHIRAGEGHAEVNALASASESPASATAYVSMEPCSHQGKTGPCSQALIKAGIRTVVFGMEDPNPQVRGRGLAQLREAGVEVIGPVLEADARRINPGFNKRMETGVPFVRIKLAMSLDGRTAMASGESKWITGAPARSDGQRLRASSGAIITGVDTILLDDSSLNVRAEDLKLENASDVAKRQPLRVILDSKGRLPASARLLSLPGKTLVINASDDVARLPASDSLTQITLADHQGRIDLRAMLKQLAERECNEVLVEAGATLAGQFVQQGLVDEIIIYMAPKLLGSTARPLLELPLQSMAGQLPLKIKDVRAVGDDWRIVAVLDREM